MSPTFLGCGRSSVYTWVKLAREHPEALAAKAHLGRTPRFQDADREELEWLWHQGPRLAHPSSGSPVASPTSSSGHFRIHLHPEHVRKILKRKLGWTSQKLQWRAKERDEVALDHRRRHELPKILAKARRCKAHLVFFDESGFMLTPTVRRTYAPRGETPDPQELGPSRPDLGDQRNHGEPRRVASWAWRSGCCRTTPTPGASTRWNSSRELRRRMAGPAPARSYRCLRLLGLAEAGGQVGPRRCQSWPGSGWRPRTAGVVVADPARALRLGRGAGWGDAVPMVVADVVAAEHEWASAPKGRRPAIANHATSVNTT